jgi:hypothetical protein
MFSVRRIATNNTLSAVLVLSQYRACSFSWHTASFCWPRRAFSSSAVSRISILTHDWHFFSLYFSANSQKIHLSTVALFYEIGIRSRTSTGEILMGRQGSDIVFIDRARAQIFNRYALDPSKVARSQLSPTVLPTPSPLVLSMATCLLMWSPSPAALWHPELKWAEPGSSFLTVVKTTTFCQSNPVAVKLYLNCSRQAMRCYTKLSYCSLGNRAQSLRFVYSIIGNRELNTLVTPSKFFKG